MKKCATPGTRSLASAQRKLELIAAARSCQHCLGVFDLLRMPLPFGGLSNRNDSSEGMAPTWRAGFIDQL